MLSIYKTVGLVSNKGVHKLGDRKTALRKAKF